MRKDSFNLGVKWVIAIAEPRRFAGVAKRFGLIAPRSYNALFRLDLSRPALQRAMRKCDQTPPFPWKTGLPGHPQEC